MSQTLAAPGFDRLPWLEDKPSPPPRRGAVGEAAGWAVAATMAIAGGAYWMGAHSWPQHSPSAESLQPQVTVPLPELRTAESPRLLFEPAPQVSPAPQRNAAVERPKAERVAPGEAAPRVRETPQMPAPAKQAAPRIATAAPAVAAKPLIVWPAWQSQGASGRIARIGTFGSRQQAKLGWRYMVHAYPAVGHLQATVVQTRNSRGRAFYRFQIGTTSQAHSEVLCQWMRRIHLSCAVVGLAWKPNGVER